MPMLLLGHIQAMTAMNRIALGRDTSCQGQCSHLRFVLMLMRAGKELHSADSRLRAMLLSGVGVSSVALHWMCLI